MDELKRLREEKKRLSAAIKEEKDEDRKDRLLSDLNDLLQKIDIIRFNLHKMGVI